MLAFLFAQLSRLAGPWEKVVIVISFFVVGLSFQRKSFISPALLTSLFKTNSNQGSFLFRVSGCLASYLRLYPTMASYDYGFRVFVLTFCILMVAGNRSREYTVAILNRLVMFGVGCVICLVVNICIYPIWAGDDLHRLVVNNFKELAASLEGLINANSYIFFTIF